MRRMGVLEDEHLENAIVVAVAQREMGKSGSA